MQTRFLIVLRIAAVLALAPVPCLAGGKPPASSPPVRSEAERWVAAQVEAGEEADLGEHFPHDEAKRTLSAHFLEDLLTDALPNVKPRRLGIHILGAIFTEPIDLDNAQIAHEVWLNQCRFEGNVSCVRTHFGCVLQFDDSTFAAEADFNSMKVDATAFFRRVNFAGPTDFGSADITDQFQADGAQFRGTKETASFGNLKVGTTAFFNKAVFSGAASFVGATFGGQFLVNEARFQNEDQTVEFNGMKVADIASFNATVFAGPTDFGTAVITGQFTAEDARFTNPNAEVNFNATKVCQTAYFTHAVFAGAVDFGSAIIGDQFLAGGARFQNPEKTANFNDLRVTGLVVISKAVFSGPVSFGGATVGSQFQANETEFRGGEEANFNGLKVADIATFSHTVFTGPVDLADGSYLDLVVSQPAVGAPIFPGLDLSRTSVKRKLDVWQVHVRDLNARSLRVEGSAFLVDSQIEGSADLRFGDFTTLDVTGSRWPAKASRKLLLQGASYKTVRAAPNDEQSNDTLRQWVDQAVYSADVYGALEAFFVRQGDTDDADETYVAGRTRGREETVSRFSPGYYGNRLLQGIGYGRFPARALYACALVVALGCWFFKPARMVPQTVEDSAQPRIYNRFWFSLELFLPVVELKEADAWEPRSEYRFLRHYMRIHVLLGWILVPIALAAQSGLIK